MIASRRARPGYTILELLVVLAVLIIIGAVVLPSTNGLFGSTRPKAAADEIRGELASARAWAMQDGVPVRVALSPDGTRIRRAPEAEFDQPTADRAASSARRVEYAFEKVFARVTTDADAPPPSADQTGWITVAVFMPDGTCRDDGVGSGVTTVAVREEGQSETSGSIRVVIRGVTGQVRVTTGGGQK